VKKSEEILKCTAFVEQFRIMEQAGEITHSDLTAVWNSQGETQEKVARANSMESEWTKWP
jgi:hypothetical protein